MIYTEQTKKAMQIAYSAHDEQTDKAGVPYIFHPIHLAEQMETEDETIVALLHDVVEDTDITLDELRNDGFSERVISTLALLTHDEGVEYMDYIEALKSNPLAVKVKLADLRHNNNLARIGRYTLADLRRQITYKEAVMKLYGIPTKESDVGILDRKRIPLDDRELWFLSIFVDEGGRIIKYSIDVEKAEDSHYELVVGEYNRLASYFGHEGVVAGLKHFIEHNSEPDFVDLLEQLEVIYTPFHYSQQT